MYGYNELTSRNFQTLILLPQNVGKMYLSPFSPGPKILWYSITSGTTS